eukprot:jgi/Bigna1/89965/estExt_fgenesh1_pg.C_590038
MLLILLTAWALTHQAVVAEQGAAAAVDNGLSAVQQEEESKTGKVKSTLHRFFSAMQNQQATFESSFNATSDPSISATTAVDDAQRSKSLAFGSDSKSKLFSLEEKNKSGKQPNAPSLDAGKYMDDNDDEEERSDNVAAKITDLNQESSSCKPKCEDVISAALFSENRRKGEGGNEGISRPNGANSGSGSAGGGGGASMKVEAHSGLVSASPSFSEEAGKSLLASNISQQQQQQKQQLYSSPPSPLSASDTSPAASSYKYQYEKSLQRQQQQQHSYSSTPEQSHHGFVAHHQSSPPPSTSAAFSSPSPVGTQVTSEQTELIRHLIEQNERMLNALLAQRSSMQPFHPSLPPLPTATSGSNPLQKESTDEHSRQDPQPLQPRRFHIQQQQEDDEEEEEEREENSLHNPLQDVLKDHVEDKEWQRLIDLRRQHNQNWMNNSTQLASLSSPPSPSSHHAAGFVGLDGSNVDKEGGSSDDDPFLRLLQLREMRRRHSEELRKRLNETEAEFKALREMLILRHHHQLTSSSATPYAISQKEGSFTEEDDEDNGDDGAHLRFATVDSSAQTRLLRAKRDDDGSMHGVLNVSFVRIEGNPPNNFTVTRHAFTRFTSPNDHVHRVEHVKNSDEEDHDVEQDSTLFGGDAKDVVIDGSDRDKTGDNRNVRNQTAAVFLLSSRQRGDGSSNSSNVDSGGSRDEWAENSLKNYFDHRSSNNNPELSQSSSPPSSSSFGHDGDRESGCARKDGGISQWLRERWRTTAMLLGMDTKTAAPYSSAQRDERSLDEEDVGGWGYSSKEEKEEEKRTALLPGGLFAIMQFQKGNAESRMVMKDSGQDITRSLRSSKEGRVMEVLASNRHQAGPHPPPVRRRIIVTNGASQFFLFTPAQLKEQREQDSAISSPYFSGEGLGGGTFKNHLDYLGRIPKRIGDTCAKLPASFRNFMGQSMDKVVRFRQQATTEEQEEQRGDLNIFSTICENRTYNPSVSDNSDEREGKCESPAPVGVHANMIDNNDPDPKFSSSSLSPPANLRRMEEGWEESDSLGEAAAKSLPNAVAKRILTVVRKATSLTLGDLVDYIKRGRQEQEDGGTAEEGSNATISTSLSTDAADYIKTENGRSVEHSYKGSSSNYININTKIISTASLFQKSQTVEKYYTMAVAGAASRGFPSASR